MTVLSMGNTFRQKWVTAAIVPICALCGWRSAQLWRGETPDNARYHFQKWQTHPEMAEELDRALALNPRYTAAWIARGLSQERDGTFKQAEANLLKAAETDRTYLPAWTLANFYLRAGDRTQFWKWTQRAGSMAPDLSSLFGLCWRVSADAREILEQGIPPDRAVRRRYLDFLLRTNRFEAAGALAREIIGTADASDTGLILRYCDAALGRREIGPSREIWEGLIRKGLIPYPAGSALTNGDLARIPTGRCFDWRSHDVAGTGVSFDADARELLVSLSGKQPEVCDLVEQYLILQPGAGYKFRFRFRTYDFPSHSGLAWFFVNAKTGVAFATAAVPGQAMSGWSESGADVSIPPGMEASRIVLRYLRPTGAVRTEGAVKFSRIGLDAIP